MHVHMEYVLNILLNNYSYLANEMDLNHLMYNDKLLYVHLYSSKDFCHAELINKLTGISTGTISKYVM